MAGQDVGFFDTGGPCLDLVIENGDLKADDTLETAALISVFSDKRQNPDDLPEGDDDPRGWWADGISEPADDEIGSLVWISDRGKTDTETLNQIEDSLRDAFQWMLDDGIASAVNVSSAREGNEKAVYSVQVSRPKGDNIPFKFLWDNQELRRIAA
jgi:phage gp46-like protein